MAHQTNSEYEQTWLRVCPKCGGGHAYGPKFVEDKESLRDPRFYVTREWLEYECATCGYKSRERCKDAK